MCSTQIGSDQSASESTLDRRRNLTEDRTDRREVLALIKHRCRAAFPHRWVPLPHREAGVNSVLPTARGLAARAGHGRADRTGSCRRRTRSNPAESLRLRSGHEWRCATLTSPALEAANAYLPCPVGF